VRDLQTFIKDINMLFKKSSLAVAASLLAIGNAYAATATANVPININAVLSNPATCTLSVNGYAAPSYTSGTTSSITTVISGLVNCSGSSTPVSFSLSADAGQFAFSGSRRAASGSGATANFINYTLLQGTGTSTTQLDAVPPVFGGTPQNGTTAVTGTTSSVSYGFRMVVPANQTVVAGSYADTVVITATY
jgi:spore coat protein U-like protein